MTPLPRVILTLSLTLSSVPALSQDKSPPIPMFADIATRMVEDGKTDNSRLYLFYFTHSDFECSKAADGAALPFAAPWIGSPGYCDRRYCPEGAGRFSCTRRSLGHGKFEYTFRLPAGLNKDGYSSHRLVMRLKPYRIFEYAGLLANYEGLDRTIKAAQFIPLISATEKYSAQEVDLGCSKVVVPAIQRN
jgi:hypothetical protein